MKSIYPVFPMPVRTALRTACYLKPFTGHKWLINPLIFAAFLFSTFSSKGQVVYVSPSGAGNHDGSSWANAATLAEAAFDNLNCIKSGCVPPIANCNNTLWLMQGTYTDDPHKLGFGAYINAYGGFQGNETSLAQRNPALYLTKIINMTGAVDQNNGDSIGVVDLRGACGNLTGPDGHPYMTMDGIYFDNDKFWLFGSSPTFVNCVINNCVFGVFNNSGNLTAVNCTFQNGTSVDMSSNPNIISTFTNCTFQNLSGSAGAAINSNVVACNGCTFDAIQVQSAQVAPVECNYGTFNHCSFLNCSGYEAGAVHIFGGAASSIQNSTFTSTTSSNSSGAVSCGGQLNVTACKFTFNTSAGFGGAIYHSVQNNTSLTVENCLFTNNSAGTSGGAIYEFGGAGSSFLMNTFVNNTSPGYASAFQNEDYGGPVVNNIFQNSSNIPAYSDNSAGHPNNTIIKSNNISSDGSIGTKVNDATSINSCFPGVNAGDNNYTGGQDTDLAGNPRIYGDTVDLGCYELQGPKYATPSISYVNLPDESDKQTYICNGSLIQLSYQGSVSANTYNWYDNGTLVAATAGQTLQIAPPPGQNIYTVAAQLSCSLQSDSTIITVAPSLNTATLNTASPAASSQICPGTPVVATFNAGTGGENCPATDSYKYSMDGGYTFHPYTPGDTINTEDLTTVLYIVATRTGCGCSVSNEVAYWSPAAVTPTITISASPELVLPGTPVTFTATTTFAGPSPHYQWLRNNQNVGTSSSTYLATNEANGAIYKCVLTNASNPGGCVTTSTATSNSLPINFLSDSAWLSTNGPCAGSTLTLSSQLNPAMVVWQDNGNNIDTFTSTWNPQGNVIGNPADTVPLASFTDAHGNTYVGYKNQVILYAPGDYAGTVGPGQYSGVQNLTALFVDESGNIYTATATYVYKYPAGTQGAEIAASGFDYGIRGIYVDAQGYLYTADGYLGIVYKWLSPTNPVIVAGQGNGGSNAANDLQNPYGITVDAHGNMYIADYGNNRVQKWAPGATSGTTVAGGHGAGNAANQLNGPTAVCLDQLGNIYINDSANFRIQMWAPGATSGTTIAGGNGQGNNLNQFYQPRNLNMDINGNLYVTDKGDGISNQGRVLQFNPVINNTLPAAQNGYYQAIVFPFLNGTVPFTTASITTALQISAATVTTQVSISANPGNEVCNGMPVQFVANPVNGGTNPVYQWFVNGNLLPAAGPDFYYGGANQGDKISCIMSSNAICAATLIDTSNIVTLVAPTTSVSIALQGGGTGVCHGAAAVFTATPGIAGSNYFYQWFKNGQPAGNTSTNYTYLDSTLAVGDVINCMIINSLSCANPRQAISNSIQITNVYTAAISAPYGTCAGPPLFDSLNFAPASLVWTRNGNVVQTQTAQWNSNGVTVAGGLFSGNDNQSLFNSSGMFVDANGFVYASSASSNIVEKWSQVDTGSAIVAGQAGVAGSAANQLNQPGGVFVDASGNVYVADIRNYRVQKWAPEASQGVTVAGGNGQGNSASQLGFIGGIFVDASGNIYIADESNQRIQEWMPGASTGITVAGTANQFNSSAPDSFLQNPGALYVDASGNMYICDQYRVVYWPAGASDGQTVAGGYNNQGSGANQLGYASGVWVDNLQNLYISDASNNRIQLWQPGATQGITVAGGNGFGNNSSQIASPSGVFVDNAGNIYVNDEGNSRVQKFSPMTNPEAIAGQPGIYTLTASSFGGCSTVSNPVVVNSSAPPGITISAQPSNNICAGTPVTFKVSDSNAGATPLFTWIKNGSVVSTDTTYTDVFGNGDNVYCIMQSSAPCVQPPIVVSNTVTINVIGNNTGSVLNQSICAGNSYYFNGQFLTATGTYFDTLTSVTGCDSIVMLNLTVTPVVITSALVTTTSSFPICAGSGASFAVQVQNGGTSPMYQWYLNGGVVGTNSANYSAGSLNNNDQLYCVVTSNAQCASPATTGSNTFTVTTRPLLTPTVSIAITNGSNNICSGALVTFNATAVNAEGDITYTFKVNGISAQSSSSAAFSSYLLNNNDSVSCSISITNSGLCLSSNTAASNSIGMQVSMPPVITCAGNDTVNTYKGLCSSFMQVTLPVVSGGCGSVSVTLNRPAPYSTGTTAVTWTAVDQSGHGNQCTQFVTVIDNELPTITAPQAVSANTDSGHCYAGNVVLGSPNTSDNCGVASVTNNAPAQFPTGTTTVIWTVTDVHGNTNTDSQTVTVIDNEAPAITCSPDIAVTANQTGCNKPLVISAPATSDNCGVASVTNNFNNSTDASGVYPVGTTSVLWTATDIHGNTAFCTQTVLIYPCIQITGSASNTICSGTANGSVSIIASGGNGSYAYLWNNGLTAATINNLAAGTYIVTVTDQAQGSATASFAVGTTVATAKPATPGAITGPSTLCSNAIDTYSISAVTNATSYIWSIPSNASIVSGQGTTQLIVNFAAAFSSGTVSVIASNCKGNSGARSLNIKLLSAPAAPASIGGPKTVCPATSETYAASKASGATSYTWVVPDNASITSGQGSATVIVQFNASFTGGNIGVYASNCIGNSDTTQSAIRLTPVPATPAKPTGATAVCSNEIYQYGIPALIRANSYTWTVPANATLLSGQGTTSITVQYSSDFAGGYLDVYATGCSGNGPVRTLQIRKMAVPARPGIINGSQSVCTGDSYAYSIDTVVNATSYTWATPANAIIASGQGSSNVTVTFTSAFTGGSLSVFASDCSGNGAIETKKINKTTSGCSAAKTDESGLSTSREADSTSPAAILSDDFFNARIYPNPFVDKFYISMQSSNNSPVQISIFTIEGALVASKTYGFNGQDIAYAEGLAAGVYLVEIKQHDKTKVLRLIKSQ